ncbi:HPP family protein [Solibacillus sp. CAU 1738]|uniref:HPP family protein n=1 Tax=Solibacillus sp. CAU 1738 TaxID=3140363 RepID=UPI0032611CB9
MKGGEKVSHRTNFADAFTAALGGFLSIGTLLLLTSLTGAQWLMATLAGSCVLVFGAWNAPFSQPRNIIGGHLLTSTIGIITYNTLGATTFSISFAICISIFLMMMTKTVHPPAGANPLIILLNGYSWSYLITPVLIGSIIIVVYALIINNIRQNRKYPLFW